MPRVKWHAFKVRAAQDGVRSTLLEGLLDRVVASGAERLQVVRVEEQFFVTAMRDDVINNVGRRDAPDLSTEDAQREEGKVPCPDLSPLVPVEVAHSVYMLSSSNTCILFLSIGIC